MKVYKLHRALQLPISLEQSWAFFSDPQNLQRITPPDLGFDIRTDVSNGMPPGMLISYALRLPTGNRVTWVSEIKHVDPPYGFVDEQRLGPYRFWSHEHRVAAHGQGVEATDTVHYALPFGPLGRLAHELFVGNQLRKIFDYRARALLEHFDGGDR